jgi:regulator of sirC expression with transglutaminase-like and TPR domain
MMIDRELTSLLRLLEDDDTQVTSIVTNKILEKGAVVITDLEKAWESSDNQNFQRKIEDLIHGIQFNILKSDLSLWLREGTDNLLYGAFLVARYQYPDLEYIDIEEEIEILKRAVWIELHENLTALEKVRIINHILFAVNNFTGNTTNYFSPGNSFINQVLESRKGNPITLSVIYASIARKLDIPVYGVNLPLNYLLAYVVADYHEDPDNVLFYINPFNLGTVLGRKEIEHFLKEQKLDPLQEYFRPCSNRITIERILRNLFFAFEKQGQSQKVNEINDLLKLF